MSITDFDPLGRGLTRSGRPAVEEAHGAVIHRSARRRKTIEARFEAGQLHVFVPDNMSSRREREAVEQMRSRVEKSEAARRARRSVDLDARARELARRWFEVDLRWHEISFMRPSATRYGWCDTRRRTIRISAELIDHPSWVLDYVIVHELAHLIEPGHGDDFWRLVRRYPRADRARGYLEGHAAASGGAARDPDSDCDVDEGPDAAQVEPTTTTTSVPSAGGPPVPVAGAGGRPRRWAPHPGQMKIV